MADSILDAAKNLTAKDLALAVVWFLGSVAPGFLIVFYFLPDVAKSYDFLKLLLISASFSLPLVAVNLAISIAIAPDQEHRVVGHWFDASAAASSSTYVSLYIVYYFNRNFPTFVLILLILNLLAACFFGLLSRWAKADTAP